MKTEHIDLYIEYILNIVNTKDEFTWLIHSAMENPNELKQNLTESIQDFIDEEINGSEIDQNKSL